MKRNNTKPVKDVHIHNLLKLVNETLKVAGSIRDELINQYPRFTYDSVPIEFVENTKSDWIVMGAQLEKIKDAVQHVLEKDFTEKETQTNN